MTTSAQFKVIRGGRLLDAPGRRWDAMDVLIEGNRIADIVPPGLAAPQEAEELIDGDVVYWHKAFSRFDVSRLRPDIEGPREELAGLNRDARDLAERLEEHVAHHCADLGRKAYHVHALAGGDY